MTVSPAATWKAMVVWRLRYQDIGLLLMSPLVRYLNTGGATMLRLGIANWEAGAPQNGEHSSGSV